ncbi:transmembrane protein sting [Osmia lignaria lignaria]|uniref:transmembrane protein sting n=1 Tax=Osmia lignaria lignaria TaxID=1437193 RepID=UPI00402B080E
MDNKIKLSLISCTISGILIKMYFQATNDNSNLTSSKKLFYIILCINAIVVSMNILLRSYPRIKNAHSNTYNTDFTNLMNNNLKNYISTSIFSIQLMIYVILTVINYENLYNYIQKFEVLISCMLILSALVQIIDIIDQDKESPFDINSMQGLDYGTGMAYSYYYGYLRLVLPTTGSLNKGLIEKLENIEDENNIRVAVHKLLILIPESSYVPPDLKEASYKWMESARTLEEEIRDRAGVKNRIYRNSLYKIFPDGDRNSTPVYVPVEGATPLVTFGEVQKHAHPETKVYSKYRKDVIKRFHEKLKELISSDPECADKCELIYYNDYDENGMKVNVAKVILDRLQRSETYT